MTTEEGTVVSILDNGEAEVKVGRHSDCIACGACPGAEHIVVKALNPVGAKVGQHVRFQMREINIVIGAFVCFIMPLLICAAGAIGGHYFALSHSYDPTQTAIIGGIIGFLVGVIGVKLFDRSLTHDVKAKPKITEIC